MRETWWAVIERHRKDGVHGSPDEFYWEIKALFKEVWRIKAENLAEEYIKKHYSLSFIKTDNIILTKFNLFDHEIGDILKSFQVTGLYEYGFKSLFKKDLLEYIK